jgi:hypothetical protein
MNPLSSSALFRWLVLHLLDFVPFSLAYWIVQNTALYPSMRRASDLANRSHFRSVNTRLLR